MKFSIVIPTYGKIDLVTTCVKSIKKFEPKTKDYEIIVVDDFSTQENREKLKGLAQSLGFKLVQTSSNVGFASAANAGIHHSAGEKIVLCNNDVIFTGAILDKFEKSHTKFQAAVVGCKLFYPSGQIQHGGGAYFSGGFHHTNDPKTADTSRYCIYTTFALASIERKFIDQFGALDAKFFMACDDAEFCTRVWRMDHRVVYDASISAIHAEGATRGRTTSEKKKNQKCWEAEQNAIRELRSYLYDIDHLLTRVRDANKKIEPVIKLEIGSGYNPQPGYRHVDARKDLPQLDHCLDFSKDVLPYEHSTVAEILSNHSIEHISYRALPFVLREWERVLKPGGRLFLRTPDLEFIVKTYLAGKTTKEWPDDEKFIEENFGAVTPAWWANIKLFAGQDYPGNFHNLCFDFPMLENLLRRYGFEKIIRLSVTPEFSPGELQVEAFKKIPKQRIRVRRAGALGDVILMTPLLQTLAKTKEVHVTTDCPQVFEKADFVKTVNSNMPCEEFLDLDLAYEMNPKMHIIDAYALKANCPESKDAPTVLWKDEPPLHATNYVVLHPAKTWENRTWPKEYWEELAGMIARSGKMVITVGSGSDFVLAGASNLRNQTIHQIAGLIDGADAFIGADSGILHIAGTTGTPLIGIFTCAKGEFRLPRRKNVFSMKTSLDCYGCLHEEKPPVTYVGCKRGDFACVREIKPAHVFSIYKAFSVNRLLAHTVSFDPLADPQG